MNTYLIVLLTVSVVLNVWTLVMWRDTLNCWGETIKDTKELIGSNGRLIEICDEQQELIETMQDREAEE